MDEKWWVVYFEDGREVGRAEFESENLAQRAAMEFRQQMPKRRETQYGQGTAPQAELYLTQSGNAPNV
jgi:hypothetical protein